MGKNKKKTGKKHDGNGVTMVKVWDRLVAKENEYPAGLKREFPELKYADVKELISSTHACLSKSTKPFIDEVMDRVPRVFTALRKAIEANQDSDYIMSLTALLETDLRNGCFLLLRSFDTMLLLLYLNDKEFRDKADNVSLYDHDWENMLKKRLYSIDSTLLKYSKRNYVINTNFKGEEFFDIADIQDVAEEISTRVPILFDTLLDALKNNQSRSKEVMSLLERDLRDMGFVVRLCEAAWSKAF